MEKTPLDEKVVERLSPHIIEVWNQIGHDAEGFITSNMEAVEICLDAGRMDYLINQKEAYQFYESLVEQHGYVPVLEFLSKHVSLW